MIQTSLKELRGRIQEELQEELFLSPLQPDEQANFEERFVKRIGQDPDPTYVEFLQVTDGLVYEGFFLYSAVSRQYPGSDGVSLEIIDLNLMYREDASVEGNYIVYGESDMELIVQDVNGGKFQIRDKVGFDTVYEEYDSMRGLLLRVIELIEERVWG